MRSFNREDFIDDPQEIELLNLYNLMDSDKKTYDSELSLEHEILERDINSLLEKLNINYKFAFSKINKVKLNRIFETYGEDEFYCDNDNECKELNPRSIVFRNGNYNPKSQLFTLGYYLGTCGTLGKYYKLLVSDNFSAGYITGRTEQLNYNDDPTIRRDIERYYACMKPVDNEQELYIPCDNRKLIKKLVKDAID